MDIAEAFGKLKTFIDGARRILVVIPEGPDGDSVGSMLALAEHGDALRKEVICYSPEPIPHSFHFLPGVERIVTTDAATHARGADLILFVDAGDIRRAKLDAPLLDRDRARTAIVNIDHHPPGVRHPLHDEIALHVVDHRAAATTEILYRYFMHHGHEISTPMATCLLTGILTDTGSFSNLGTTFSSMAVAGELLKRGATITKIADHTLKNKTVDTLRLWGRALSRLEMDPSSGIVTTVITQDDFRACHATKEATEGVANFLNSLAGAKAVLVLREDADGKIKGSFRTTQSDVDVAKMAQAYGGGGHKKAAGFTVTGRLERTPTGWAIVPVA